MKTILYGNGFNRLNSVTSWEKLVHFINDSKDKYKIPNTLHFESRIYTTTDEETLLNDIANSMKLYQGHKLFSKLLMLDADYFITTNYDYVADNTLTSLNYSENESERDKSEILYSIHRKICYTKKGKNDKYLWRIHGEISNPKSIILGYDRYCNYIGQIKDYINGKYPYPPKTRISGIVPRMKVRISHGLFTKPISWIDLFFFSNIYIIGLGLYYDEIDLWWILTIRKRLMKELGKGIITNTIVYYGDPDPGMKSLLISLGVDVFTSKAKKYENKYKDYIKDIKTRP